MCEQNDETRTLKILGLGRNKNKSLFRYNFKSLLSHFQPLMNWLGSSLPAFPVKPDQVNVIYKPEDFYNILVQKCSCASKRILLVSLYLGTGEKEKHLVNVISTRAKEQGTSLRIRFILDAIRGSRGNDNNSRTMLLPLIQQNPHSQVSLFHSPKLNGFLYRILPMRFNELIGLQHMKIYVIDDDVIISGANLSHDYFVNRQDRYIHIKDCPRLADFFDGLVGVLGDMSFQLNGSNEMKLLTKHNPYLNPYPYAQELNKKITKYYSSFISLYRDYSKSDTWIFPTIELPPCSIHIDTKTTKNILENLPPASIVYLASGYFNITKNLQNAILSSKAEYDILMAHPTANGFYNSPGISRYVPLLYTAIEKKFFELLELKKCTDRIRMFEYQKTDWTYHGKGIWISLPGEMLPRLSIVGSSNYGSRSEYRDLEAQLIIVTDNFELRKKLYREQRHLFDFGGTFNRTTLESPDRYIPFWINSFVFFLQSLF